MQALTDMSSTCAAQTCHVLRMLSHSHACQSTNAPARVMRSQLATKQAGSIIYANDGAAGAAHAAQTHQDSSQRFVPTARPSLQSLAAEKEAAEQQRKIRFHRGGAAEPATSSGRKRRDGGGAAASAMHDAHALSAPPSYSNSRTKDLGGSRSITPDAGDESNKAGGAANTPKGKALWRGLKKTMSGNRRTSKESGGSPAAPDGALQGSSDSMNIAPGEHRSPCKHSNSTAFKCC